jgi:exodeoxyribonuclease-3
LCAAGEDGQARVIAATIKDIRVFCVYAPNGQAVGSPPFQYKLRWFVELRDCIAKALNAFRDVVVCGDFNVAPDDRDVHDPRLWRGAIMCSEEERAAFRALEEVGLRDTLRIHHADAGLFSWWDYRMMAFQKNRGLRIDEILVTDSLAKRCTAAGINREMRGGKDPSDHAPIWAEFSTAMSS